MSHCADANRYAFGYVFFAEPGRQFSMRQAETQFLIAPYISLIVLASACSIFGGAGGSSSTIPIPGAGQWVDFGRNEPTISSGAFTFPGPGGVAHFYTKPPATIAQGQTVTLVYASTVALRCGE